MCNVICCLITFVIVGLTVMAKQYDIINTLLETDFDFSATFWLTFSLTHAFIVVDVLVSILALTGQVGKYIQHTKTAVDGVRDEDEGRQEAVSYVVEEGEGLAEDRLEKKGEQTNDPDDEEGSQA